MAIEIRRRLAAPSLGVMTFLNEVVQRYPNAISLAPGRPSDQFCEVGDVVGGIDRWIAHRAATTGLSSHAVRASLGQYGDTAGIIRDLVARHLEADLGIRADESSIVITTGCQEAMLISALTLLEPATDTLLVSDPSYIGMTGIAQLANIPVQPVPSTRAGLRAADVEAAIRSVERSGRRPRALYDIPDFNNPLGTCMPLAERHALLELAARSDLVILEDNPYGAFAYDAPALPTLKALDTAGCVVYLGSFAKTLFPGLRIGYIVADQRVSGTNQRLAQAMTTVKSLTTVNTSPVLQAMAGSALLEHGGSLEPLIAARVTHYRENRDCMLACLAQAFGDGGDRVAGVEWNHPPGGFFLVVRLPFEFGAAQLERCAGNYGVIVSPMSYFALTPGREREVRLSFSYVDRGAITEAIQRFARFVRAEIAVTLASPQRMADEGAESREVVRESRDDLVGLVERGLTRRGVPRDDAAFVSRALVEASLRGVDTHGLRLLPTYLRELEGGRARSTPDLRWLSTHGAVRLLDADAALGVVAGRVATEKAIELARANGVGVVVVRNSNHFGPASAYTIALARAGLIGIAGSNSDALVAAFNGSRPTLGTNPLSVAAVADGDDLFCADFATSQVAYSRVRAYRAAGWEVPNDWIVAGASAATAPVVLKPLGGYKGQCLGMTVELLSSVLGGGARGDLLSHFYDAPFSDPRDVSHFVIAIDPASFGNAPAFRSRLADLLDFVRGEDAGRGLRVIVPGDLEAATVAERLKNGIPLVEPELGCIRSLIEEDAVVVRAPDTLDASRCEPVWCESPRPSCPTG